MNTDLIRQHLDAAQQALDQSQVQTALAQTDIDAALQLLAAAPPEEIIPPPDDAIHVGPGDDLLAALAGAAPGALVVLDPAYVGDLGFWEINKTVTLETSGALLAARVGLGLAGPVLRGLLTVTAPGVTLRGLRLETPTSDGTAITAGPGQTIDRCVVLGSPAGAHRGVLANAPDVTIVGCHIGNIWKDIDTQAVAAWDGARNLRIEDCFLEASGENVLIGGADCASEDAAPADITIENCHLFKPLAWRDKPGCTVKNLYELKHAKRATMRNCRLENCWAGGQVGFAIVLTVRNQDGTNPYATIEDCLIEDCTVVHSAQGVQILGHDDCADSQTMARVTLRRVVFEDLGAYGRQMQISGGPVDLTIEDCAFHVTGLANTLITLDQPSRPLEGFVYRGNFGHEGEYGIMGTDAPSGGEAALDMYCPSGYVWEANTVVDDGERAIEYPAGTTLIPPAAR